MRTYVFFFFCALIGSMALTPAVRMLALRHGLLDRLGARKIHDQPIPRLGGVAIFLAFLIPFGGFLIYRNWISQILMSNLHELMGIMAGGTAIFLLGLYDDLRGARARVKLLVEIAAACVVYALGVQINSLANPFAAEPFHFGHIVGLPFTVIWIVGVTNAVNLSDGIDGLAAGLSIFVGATVAIMALIMGHPVVALLSITLVGSIGGFLVFNFPPAKIFMGDSGALFLGFMLSSISILGSMKSTTAVALVIPIFAMIVPISDTLMAMARRVLQGRGMMVADKDHIHHRLLKRGLTNHQVLMVLYLTTIVFGGIALLTLYTNHQQTAFLLGAGGVLVVILIRRLGYREFNVNKIPETLRESSEQRKRTREEREVIKQFEDKIKNFGVSTHEICMELMDTVRSLGYTAVEVKPSKGTSLFRKLTDPTRAAAREVEEPALFWADPMLEDTRLNIKWYIEVPIICGENQIATLKVYKDAASETQQVHDEVILDLLCQVIGDIVPQP